MPKKEKPVAGAELRVGLAGADEIGLVISRANNPVFMVERLALFQHSLRQINTHIRAIIRMHNLKPSFCGFGIIRANSEDFV